MPLIRKYKIVFGSMAPTVAGSLSEFQWGEVVSSVALTAAGWLVADSYRPII